MTVWWGAHTTGTRIFPDTQHAASSYGQPVLVNRATGEAFGPGDILKPYPSYGFMPAAEAVRRLAKTAKLDAEGRDLAAKFADLHVLARA